MAHQRVVQSGADDLAELGRIYEARPKGKDVLEAAKKVPGVVTTENDAGQFTATARRGDARAASELAHMLDKPRQLEQERAQKLAGRRDLIMVRNREGKLVEVNAESEAGLSRAGLIEAPSRTFLPPAGVPRCLLAGMDHDYRQSGRCWWCGKAA